MELKYIEIYCAVVELKSFSKAAQALHLTQPTISIHVKALEEEFSTKLLDRLGRTVTPTQDGEILYRYAKEIMHLKENARLAMQRVSEAIGGKLAVGASTIPGEYIVPQLLARFKIAYPDVFPALRIADSHDILESVLRGDVDLGIIGTGTKDKNITVRKFMDDELILVSSGTFKASILDKAQLAAVPLLVREAGSGSRSSAEDHLKRAGLAPESLNVAAEMGSSQALIQAVKSGMGFAFLSKLSVDDDIKRGTLKQVRVKGITLTRNFYIITHRLRFNTRICRTFIDFISKPGGNG